MKEEFKPSCPKVNGVSYAINNIYNKIIFNEIVNRNIYNFTESDSKVVDTLIDVGGNVGYFSLYCSKFLKNIIAFEPETENFKAFQKNILANEFTNITLINKAVADITTKMAFHVSKASANRHTLEEFKYTFSKPTVMVDCVGINEVFSNIESHNCSLKMDIEGGEYRVLPALNQDSINKIKMVMLELHEYPDKKWSHVDILNWLTKNNFKYTVTKDADNKWYKAYIVKGVK